MARRPGLLAELDAVPPDIAWSLVDPLFRERVALLTGATVFLLLACICYAGTGSPWYAAGGLAVLVTTSWRLWLGREYARHRDAATPRQWAGRALRGAWAAAAVWGAWSGVILFEPDRAIVAMLIGVHASFVIGGAVRNNAVRVIAAGQVLLTEVPAIAACLGAHNVYLNVYAAFLVSHILTGLSLTHTLHGQRLGLLLANRELVQATDEKDALLKQLEVTNRNLARVNDQLSALAAIDTLTGVANRRSFDLLLERVWRQAARDNQPLSLLMLDVDYFKKFNDRYGHPVGDSCLRAIAAAAAAAIQRPGDIFARYGGEEFAAVLPNTEPNDAAVVAERIMQHVRACAAEHAGSPLGHVSMSIGAACVWPAAGDTAGRLVMLADAALYAAKRGGRDRVHLAEPPEAEAGAAAALPPAIRASA